MHQLFFYLFKSKKFLVSLGTSLVWCLELEFVWQNSFVIGGPGSISSIPPGGVQEFSILPDCHPQGQQRPRASLVCVMLSCVVWLDGVSCVVVHCFWLWDVMINNKYIWLLRQPVIRRGLNVSLIPYSLSVINVEVIDNVVWITLHLIQYKGLYVP